ncbi:MAG: GatB/YqeY domain-containing protein [Candidatus Omnitrophica bacterium]|nr:GatB/YqeY domain-containing protein [Candidatus Omnitrophota bacterium]MBU1037803.1 GatB/YqeY domain-containing protein [Candidatus Omnitrophota bacterium]MBU1808443.1 GatB/YqeY domain-containing protein [Candidatus Omnitrophota bacterium]
MSLYEKIESDMRTALKESNALTLSVLRMLVAAIRQAQMNKNSKSVEDTDVLQMLHRHIKQHKESIVQFENGKRQDLVDKELAELRILEAYMPEQISEEELKNIVNTAISESGAKTKSDMGKVMKLVMDKTKGSSDGKIISQMVMGLLQ